MNRTLDACALLALLNGEDGADIVDVLLEQAQDRKITLYMNAIQLLEVYYDRIRVSGFKLANEILESILAYPITIIDTISRPILDEAARIKATYSLSLGDAVGLATAIAMGGAFVTSDHHDLDRIDSAEPGLLCWFR
jgi:predicted nucleic acid-binding protein